MVMDSFKDAYEKGIRNFIVERPTDLKDCNCLVVEDSKKALQQIGAFHRSQFTIPIIGITGSNGKTTVKEWLSTLLSEKFFIVKSPKSYNSQIGVPLSLLELNKGHEIGVFEAGISKVDEMHILGELIQPTIGIFTNLGEAHDDGFQSREQKLNEKLRLFDTAKQVICRKDTSYFHQIQDRLRDKVLTWSLLGEADFQVNWVDHKLQINDSHFQVDFDDATHLENLTHAVIAALHLGLSNEAIQRGIDLIKDVPMRLELKRGINGCYMIDDSYNNDEAGLRVALDYMESHQQNEKKTLILSDILHSNKSDEELYRGIADLLRSKKVSRLIGIGDRISAHQSLFDLHKEFFETTEAMLQQMPHFQDEMILIKGARNFRLEQVVRSLEEKNHGTVLEVNFEAMQHNLNQYRSLLQPSTRLMVMVKANAYGTGLLEVANFLQHQRVDMLGVAYVDEAVQLRKNGIKIPIMIMNPHIQSFEQFERYDLQAEIFQSFVFAPAH